MNVIPGTYANADVANTILFADALPNSGALFGIRNGDAIWAGSDSRWYINHHVFDSEVINSEIEFDLMIGGADNITIQLGNRSANGWMLDNDYAFGGYQFIIDREGKVYARIEYYYGVDESGRKTSSYGIADYLGTMQKFDPQMERHIQVSFRNDGSDKVRGIFNNISKSWTQKDWLVKPEEIPSGRVDSKELSKLYMGPKMHWSIGRVRTSQDRNDNGSLIKSIQVYKL